MMKDRKLTKYELDNIKKAKLQEKALDISLGVGVLNEAMVNGNKKIKECLDKVASGEFEKGKVTITVEITTQELEAQNVINQATNSVENRTYISPIIIHIVMGRSYLLYFYITHNIFFISYKINS